jgi:hypothetical protein
MKQVQESHQQQLQDLKRRIATLREGKARVRFPSQIKARVCALRWSGVSPLYLAAELGLSTSQIYDWCKADSPREPQVLRVESAPRPAAPERAAIHQELQLRFGGLRITIDVAEA